MKLSSLLIALSSLTWVAGCGKQVEVALPASPAPGTAKSEKAASDKWAGQWNGPEGTYLQISGGEGKYEITVKNLDGPRHFNGTAAGEGIEFVRDGVRESLRATDGQGTGMKWLAPKSECLVVRAGEGYCRP